MARRVDFPLPDGPTSAIRSPTIASHVASTTACTEPAPLPYVFEIADAITNDSGIDDAAVAKMQHSIGFRDERRTMTHDQHRATALAMIGEQLEQAAFCFSVDFARRLIREHEGRVGRERHGECGARGLTAGQ